MYRFLSTGSIPVDHLVHPGGAQRSDVQHLGLTPLEQPGTMSGVHHPHLRGQQPEIGRSPAVDPNAVVHDAVAHDALGERADCG